MTDRSATTSAVSGAGTNARGKRAQRGNGATNPEVTVTRTGLQVQRIYTTDGVHPYDEVEWEHRDVVQHNWKTGDVVFEQRSVEFPTFWSANASTIVTTKKYFRGAQGTPERETRCVNSSIGGEGLRRRWFGARLLPDRGRRRRLRGRTDLDASAPGLLVQLTSLVQRRDVFTAAGQRLFHPQRG